MLNMEEWMALYQETMLRCFGERVRFIGLQGSRARGEASENSDIDVVLLLDRLAPEDLEKYRRAAAGLPRRELLCGFVSGVSELKNWERGELFQFYYDTTPVLGRLEEVITPPGREDLPGTDGMGVVPGGIRPAGERIPGGQPPVLA